MPVEARVASLLRQVAALEEAIIRLEARGEEMQKTVSRLRLVQGEILAGVALLDRDTRRSTLFPPD
jgi:hypothetical protein